MMFTELKGDDWNVRLLHDGPIKSLSNEDGVFPVLKGGKAVLKGLVMSVDQMSSNGGAGREAVCLALFLGWSICSHLINNCNASAARCDH